MSTPIRPVFVGNGGRQQLAEFAATRDGGERQRHGFVFQDFLIDRLDLLGVEGYTSKWDAYDGHQIAGGLPYSFKNIRLNAAVDLGDLSRQAGIECGFRMVLGRWSGHGLHVNRVYPLLFAPGEWRALFPADITPFLAENVFDGISNDRRDDPLWKARRLRILAEWDAQAPPDCPIRPRFKRDSKRQLRVQAAITRVGFERLARDHFDHDLVPAIEEAFDVDPLLSGHLLADPLNVGS